MLKIGLTGGIGCGKSTAARIFSDLGVEVIDADEIVHELLKSSELQKTIIEHFGKEYLRTDGTLDRRKIRDTIFKNPIARDWLEKLLHPLVIQKMQECVAKVQSPYCILAIPLLFEAKQEKLVDRILVIDCHEKMQIERITVRDKTTPEAVLAIIITQLDRYSRLRQANDIIPNDGNIEKLRKAVTMLHQHYLVLASAAVKN